MKDPYTQDQECNFKLENANNKPPQWFISYMKDFEKRLDARFDNLIKKNNLVE